MDKPLPNLAKIKRPILVWYDDAFVVPRIFYPNQKHFDDAGFFPIDECLMLGFSVIAIWYPRIMSHSKKNQIFRKNVIHWEYL